MVYFKTPSQRQETAKFCLHNQKSLAQKNCISAHERLSLTKRKDFGRKTSSRCWAKMVSLPFAPRMARLDGRTGTNDGVRPFADACRCVAPAVDLVNGALLHCQICPLQLLFLSFLPIIHFLLHLFLFPRLWDGA